MNAPHDPAVAEVLDSFVPIGDELPPAVESFAESVATHIATRPSPAPPQPSVPELLAKISAQLDELLDLLRGGTR